MFTLFLDLSHKLYVWRLYTTFQITSPMSWGSWILLLVYPALVANALAHLPESIPSLAKRFPILVTISDFILARAQWVVGIGIANVMVGIALGIYTGILLGALGARPLWNSALLGPLFLFSGLSTATALLHGILVLTTPEEERPAFADFLLSSLARLTQARPLDKDVGTCAGACGQQLSDHRTGVARPVPARPYDFYRHPSAGSQPASHRVPTQRSSGSSSYRMGIFFLSCSSRSNFKIAFVTPSRPRFLSSLAEWRSASFWFTPVRKVTGFKL